MKVEILLPKLHIHDTKVYKIANLASQLPQVSPIRQLDLLLPPIAPIPAKRILAQSRRLRVESGHNDQPQLLLLPLSPHFEDRNVQGFVFELGLLVLGYVVVVLSDRLEGQGWLVDFVDAVLEGAADAQDVSELVDVDLVIANSKKFLKIQKNRKQEKNQRKDSQIKRITKNSKKSSSLPKFLSFE